MRLSQLLLKIALVGITLTTLNVCASADEPWLANYGGNVSRERELALMDNFAIQLLQEPDLIGYILVYASENSCRGEAQARALRIRNYLMNVRGVPWNKLMWKDAGRYKYDTMQILFLGFYRNMRSLPDFPYEPPAKGQIIPTCRRLKRFAN